MKAAISPRWTITTESEAAEHFGEALLADRFTDATYRPVDPLPVPLDVLANMAAGAELDVHQQELAWTFVADARRAHARPSDAPPKKPRSAA